MAINIYSYNVATFNINNNLCHDMFVGTIDNGQYIANKNRYENPVEYAIDYINENGQIKPNCKKSLFSTNNKTIVCVLESPHIEEYKHGDYGYSAMGKTGERFDRYFKKKINALQLNDNDKYNIVLVNAVQYQCSNGNNLSVYANKKVRDDKWLSCMGIQNCKKDLVSRINSYNPDYVINLCTIGLNDLYKNVNPLLHNFNLYRDYHPSCLLFNWSKLIKI